MERSGFVNPSWSCSNSGSRDGTGAGDCDAPFQFGRRYSSLAPFPFTTREFGRLLVLRSRIQAGVFGVDDGRELPR
jgi:hypothetical protein